MTKNFWALIALIFLLLGTASVNAASCSDIWVDVQDLELERNETEYFYFPVYNDSEEDFSVFEARAYRDFGEFEIELGDYPDEIRDGDSGELTLRIETPRLDSRSDGQAYIRIRGQFENGRYCHFSGIEEAEFEVDVERGTGSGEQCNDIEIDVGNLYLNENSIERAFFSIFNRSNRDFEVYDIDLEENSSFFDVEIYSQPGFVDGNDRESFEVKVESERVSSDRQGSVTVKVRGRFQGGDYCSYSEVREEDFRVYVENYSDTRPSGSCNELYLNASTIRVEQGKSKQAKIYLENDSDEDFLVDFVQVTDSSGEINAEEAGYEKQVDAFGNAYINVRAKAFDYSEPGRYEAEVEIRGRFQNGKSCSIFGQAGEIPIVVEERSPVFMPEEKLLPKCSKFSLTAPEKVEINTSGTIPITIDNRTMDRASVRLYGPGLEVEPKLISVPRYSTISERVNVSSVLEETSLVYGIEALGCNTSERTEIVNTAETGQEEEESDGQQNLEGLEGLSTGLFAIGQGMALLGLIIIAGIVAYLILRQ
jgi:hypothetical protein